MIKQQSFKSRLTLVVFSAVRKQHEKRWNERVVKRKTISVKWSPVIEKWWPIPSSIPRPR